MVEHMVMELYPSKQGALRLDNERASPGALRLDINTPKGKANFANCPRILKSATKDAGKLIASLLAKTKGSGI